MTSTWLVVFWTGFLARVLLLLSMMDEDTSSVLTLQLLPYKTFFSWPWTYLLVGYDQSNEILVECHFRQKYLGTTSSRGGGEGWDSSSTSSMTCPSGLLQKYVSFVLDPSNRLQDELWPSTKHIGDWELKREIHSSLSANSLFLQILIIMSLHHLGPHFNDMPPDEIIGKQVSPFPLWGIYWLNPLVILSCPLSPLPSIQHLLVIIFLIGASKR